MKNILTILMMAILLTACSKSYEDKAESLIKKSMEETLYNPETYKSVSTVLDSAFTPVDDPIFYEKALRVYKLQTAINSKDKAKEKADKLIEELKKSMEEEPEFIGYKGLHRYKATNKMGMPISGEALFIFDKDVTKIVAVYDTSSTEYNIVMLISKAMQGEEVSEDDVRALTILMMQDNFKQMVPAVFSNMFGN